MKARKSTTLLKPGDRIRLSGGYDPQPQWLRGREAHRARVVRFVDNKMKQRRGDERLSALVEFDEELEFEGLRGKYGMLLLRYRGQCWEHSGTVHVNLLDTGINDISEMVEASSRWMESHAQYQTVERNSFEGEP